MKSAPNDSAPAFPCVQAKALYKGEELGIDAERHLRFSRHGMKVSYQGKTVKGERRDWADTDP
jgi:hypothetical protein